MRLRSGRTMMSGTNATHGGSDPSRSNASSGSTASSGPTISTASAQSTATVSTSIGSTRLSSGANGGGNGNGRGPWPRFEQPPLNAQYTGGFSDMRRNVAASSLNQPLSTSAIRQLIEESHLDLVNLLSSHLTMVLNPIVAITNAKYEHLAKRIDSVIRIDVGENSDPCMYHEETLSEFHITWKIMRYQFQRWLG
ncbi:hypothetical protein PIB30_039476 [Stylosanthes scabra]|uniref:Uncharacterized protein n=1 Tax=Stylosanthes scabra TaxID=79078 RepID=A0ABU6XFU3_9FABA|nr:hypothetical protein [Stylosanthes scabra]